MRTAHDPEHTVRRNACRRAMSLTHLCTQQVPQGTVVRDAGKAQAGVSQRAHHRGQRRGQGGGGEGDNVLAGKGGGCLQLAPGGVGGGRGAGRARGGGMGGLPDVCAWSTWNKGMVRVRLMNIVSAESTGSCMGRKMIHG